MANRKGLSKKTRFDVFKRDAFVCQYCGSHPPMVVLEVDHINPVVNGGTNDVDNLITACFDCNRGKSAGLLTTIPQSVQEKAELLQEKQDQLRAFERLIKAARRAEDKRIDEVENAFRDHFPGYTFSSKFRQSVRIFVQKMPAFQVVDAMHLACSRIRNMDDATKYFCGICWKTIKSAS